MMVTLNKTRDFSAYSEMTRCFFTIQNTMINPPSPFEVRNIFDAAEETFYARGGSCTQRLKEILCSFRAVPRVLCKRFFSLTD